MEHDIQLTLENKILNTLKDVASPLKKIQDVEETN